MKRARTVDELVPLIRCEAVERTRYPVRYILVQGLLSWRRLLSVLRLEVDQTITLSSFCLHDDALPDLQRFVRQLGEHSEEKLLVLPLGECIRLDRTCSSILCELALREKLTRQRIYVPLLDLNDVFQEAMQRCSRYLSGELPEVFDVDGEGDVRVTIVPFPCRRPSDGTVNGVKAYLAEWERGGASDSTLVTDLAPYLPDRLGSFQLITLRSAYEVLRHRVTGWPEKLKGNLGTELQWRWLATLADEGTSFSALACQALNVSRFDADQVSALWSGWGEDEKWLAWLWCKVEASAESYLRRVVDITDSIGEFEDTMATAVLSVEVPRQGLEERRKLLSAVGLTDLSVSFWKSYESVPDPLRQLACLTGISVRERESALRAIRALLGRGERDEIWQPYLEIAYPEIDWYLRGPQIADECLMSYFRLYARARLQDSLLPELADAASKAARERVLWKYPCRDQLLEQLGERTVIVWVDAMGLEWASVVQALLEASGNVRVDLKVARANLPSLTEQNRGWTDDAAIFRELDEVAHKYDYTYPQALVAEIDAVRRIMHEVVTRHGLHGNLAITSDHGLTRFAGRSGSLPLLDGAQSGKWGRFAIAGARPSSSLEGLWAEECVREAEKIIAATHRSFPRSGNFLGEVHGGATLEECLVPVIIVSPGTVRPPARCDVVLISDQVRLNAQREGELLIQTSGVAGEASIVLPGRVLRAHARPDRIWAFKLEGLGAGTYEGKVFCDGCYVRSVKFHVVQGFIERDLGL